VQAAKPYIYRDSTYTLKESKTAYLVLLDLSGKPKAYGPVMNIFIGDYKIPEFGGTKTGIYFRIYDTAILQKLNKQKFYYRYSGSEKIFLDKYFESPDLKKMKLENETEVLKLQK